MPLFVNAVMTLRAQSDDLNMLGRFISGTFDNHFQYLKDSTNYSDAIVSFYPIWKNHRGVIWLYWEEGLRDSIQKPFRQRVCRISETDSGSFTFDQFTVRSPAKFSGHPERMEALTPDSLIPQKGCSLRLQQDPHGRYFSGSTVEKSCPGESRGVVYTVLEITVSKHELRIWKKGFDATGQQVWGPFRGPYIFQKTGDL